MQTHSTRQTFKLLYNEAMSYQLVAKCTYIMQKKGNASFNLSLTIMPYIAGGGEVGGAAKGLSDESHKPVHHLSLIHI